ncbi:MAG: hypothetical protein K2K91_12070 [Ruminococcus sp.]|nr:hypothetical protein [Ruminococcus sp.]
MIRLKFYDYGNMQLDVEKELGIEIETEDFLITNIPSLEFEAMDFEADLEDNIIFWFSSKQELIDVQKIKKLIYSRISDTPMQFDIKITDNFD